MYVHLDQENGRERFESKIEVIAAKPFETLELLLERKTQDIPSERLGKKPNDGKTIDFYAASGTRVPVNDRYLLTYTFQPGSRKLDNKQVIGDRAYTYIGEAYFETLLYAVLANGLRMISQAARRKGANVTIKLPDEETYKPVDEQLISDLADPRAIEEMRKILREQEAKNSEKLPAEELVPVVSITMLRSA
ncbi:hypothetical protein KY360_06670 [Candidatus Woesearchaeota archaeon]|nr:hypothetical protein [Candidatus Woesearchaeota archaeon]